jgi:tetraacyldisaccharide 4'-kinase
MKAPAFWWEKPGLWSTLLSPLAAIYGRIAEQRLTQPGARVGIPVICIGNPTIGGAGKTPTAIAIARMLIAAGEKPIFLTRGYGGRLAGPVLVEAAHSAAQVGDEPLLLARVAPTVVAVNRVAGAQLAKHEGASIIVMDDGFQNPSLAKDFSLLVIDARHVGNGCVLPAGPLRAPFASQLARASAILLVGGGDPLRPTNLPVFHGALEPDPVAVSALRSNRVLAFAGIGDPDKFFATLAAAGIDAPVRRGFPDHHRFSAKEARTLLAQAERDRLTLVTTEKDLARLTGDHNFVRLAERTQPLPVTMRFGEPDLLRDALLGAIRRA